MNQTYQPNVLGRGALYCDMKRKKVYVDELPITHKAALDLLREGKTLDYAWHDAQVLKLQIRWPE